MDSTATQDNSNNLSVSTQPMDTSITQDNTCNTLVTQDSATSLSVPIQPINIPTTQVSTNTLSVSIRPSNTPTKQDNTNSLSVPIQPIDTPTTSSNTSTNPSNASYPTNVASSHSLTIELNKELNNLKEIIDKDDGVNFVIDNIDIRQNVNNMTEENQDLDCHWVNANVIFNRVSENNLADDGSMKDVMNVDNLEVLPNMDDHLAYRKNLKVHIQRILVKRIPCLRHLQDSVLMHIPHSTCTYKRREKTNQKGTVFVVKSIVKI